MGISRQHMEHKKCIIDDGMDIMADALQPLTVHLYIIQEDAIVRPL
jgi:hypothetical protein